MGYYRRYYMQRRYVVSKPMFDSTGSMISGKVFYGGASATMITDKNSVIIEDNRDTITGGCNCDSCIECDCDPSVCRCDCHTDKTLIRDFE